MVSYPNQITGPVTVTGDLNVTGIINGQEGLDISGNSTLGGNSQVDGTLTVNSDVIVAATVTVMAGNIQLGADVSIFRDSADVLKTNDYFIMPNGQSNGSFSLFGGSANSLNLGSVGCGIAIKEGTNARSGAATLVGGTVTVANTSVTANTRIQVTGQVDGGTPGWLRISARVPGTSFTITSSSVLDTSVVGWFMIEGT